MHRYQLGGAAQPAEVHPARVEGPLPQPWRSQSGLLAPLPNPPSVSAAPLLRRFLATQEL